MASSIITPEDLEIFKLELLEEIRKMLSQRQPTEPQRWLKSNDVKRLLTISTGTLQQLRKKGTLPFSRLGSTIFYNVEDVDKMLLERKQTTLTLFKKAVRKH